MHIAYEEIDSPGASLLIRGFCTMVSMHVTTTLKLDCLFLLSSVRLKFLNDQGFNDLLHALQTKSKIYAEDCWFSMDAMAL